MFQLKGIAFLGLAAFITFSVAYSTVESTGALQIPLQWTEAFTVSRIFGLFNCYACHL
jgi:hypothetical protein